MPVVRRCPKCGDDLGLDEAACVFCGHRIGAATVWERVRLGWEDWLMPAGVVAVAWLAGGPLGGPLVLGVADLVAPGLADGVRSRPGVERGLRITLALGVLAVIVVRAIRNRRR